MKLLNYILDFTLTVLFLKLKCTNIEQKLIITFRAWIFSVILLLQLELILLQLERGYLCPICNRPDIRLPDS